MKCPAFVRHTGRLLAALTVMASLARAASAQSTTGTVRGYIRDSSGNAVAEAQVQARNVASGAVRAATSGPDGAYTLLGLVPARYELTARHIGFGAQARQIDVAIASTLIADFAMNARAVELTAIQVQAQGGDFETRTSEVATTVSQAQIERLPSSSRNFLDLAALAPGVTVSPDLLYIASPNRIPARTFTTGASGPGEVNIIIDGASLKNDLTGNGASGVSGQDASRGNPFPRNAIQEYRVITQNFSAEYQKASGGIITATTRSGGNVWAGSAFATYQNDGLVAIDSFTRANNPGVKPNYSRYLVGLSGGGPLIRDRLQLFASYEGNYQNRGVPVSFGTLPATGVFPALDTVGLGRFAGSITSPFRETLLFGKLSYSISDHSSAELSINNRHETDERDFGGTAAFQSATNYVNNASLAVLKYNHSNGPWLDEAQVTYENFQRNPSAASPDLPHRSFIGFGSFSGADLGSYVTIQNFTQKRIGLRNDVTYTGLRWNGDHSVKMGVNADFLTYGIDKRNGTIPQFFYADSVCRGCNGATPQEWFGYRVPYQMNWSNGPSPFLNTHNTQIGAYIQDNWNPSSRLTINIGVRWDYESHMFNTDYVTPQFVIDSVTRYNNTLQHPIDPAVYFTNGSQRKPFLGAFQPRLGFSYALDHANKTTLFGGAGLFYDRTFFDVSVDETLKLTYPSYSVTFADPDSAPKAGEIAWNNRYLTTNPAVLDSLVTNNPASGKEVWLIANNAKVPYSVQWNVGIRHVFGDVLGSIAYVGSRGYDGFVLNWANLAMDSLGHCCLGGNFGHGITNVIYSTNSVRTWYDAIQVQVNRPYRRVGNFGWGAGFSYTAGSRYLSGIDNPGDEFAFPENQFIAKHPSNDEKSRFVGNWIMDVPFAWGIQFSGLITLGTGPRSDIGGRFNGTTGVYIPGGFSPPQYPFLLPGAWAFREVDVRLRKDFPRFSRGSMGVTLDVFNLLNTPNYLFDGNNGQPRDLAGDNRRTQIGIDYTF
jgi:hypothetical protein